MKMRAGKSPVEGDGTEETNKGNGSLMRVLPIAFYGRKLKDADLIKMTGEVSSLTYGHKRSKL